MSPLEEGDYFKHVSLKRCLGGLRGVKGESWGAREAGLVGAVRT